MDTVAAATMSPAFDALLCERDPEIFADRHNSESRMARGFECGDGWFNLIERLCYRIQIEVDQGDRAQPVAAQVKEKLGGLRIYWCDADKGLRTLTHWVTDLSLVACELCGALGEALRSARRALMVRCPAHAHLNLALAQDVAKRSVEELEGAEAGESDELTLPAAELVVRTQTASISHLQRRLKIGYSRACKLAAALERAGIISAPSDDGIRTVLRSNIDIQDR